jgi:ribosomal protein S18 acetylase RimI-like enzyme
VTHAPPDGPGRPATTDDLDAIVALFHARDSRGTDRPESMHEYLTWIWSMSSVDLERDARLVPGEEQRATRGIALPLRTSVMSDDREGRAFLEGRGFTQVRTSWDMVRGLSPHERAAEPSPRVTVRTFRAGEEPLLYRISETSFRDHWDHVPSTIESFTERMLATPWEPGLTFFAEVDGHVAGELIALPFADRGYIASVGVLREYRGRGAASAMLRRAFAALAERGLPRVELSVDAASPTGAVSLYEGLGMRAVRSYASFDGPGRGVS